MESQEANDSVQPPKRKLAKKACLHCNSAKKGCADVRPCPRCVKLGLACVERNTNKKQRVEQSGAEEKQPLIILQNNATSTLPPTSLSPSTLDSCSIHSSLGPSLNSSSSSSDIYHNQQLQQLQPTTSFMHDNPIQVASPPSPPNAHVLPLTYSTCKISAHSFAPTSSSSSSIVPQPSQHASSFNVVSSFSFLSPNASTLVPQLQQAQKQPSLHGSGSSYQGPFVNNMLLNDMLADITALQTQLLQKVHLFNALNAQLPKPLAPLPLPQVNSKPERLKVFVSSMMHYSDTCGISVWDRKTLKLLQFNDICKNRKSLVIKSPDLIVDNTSYLDVSTVNTKDGGGLLVEIIDPFNAGSPPFVKKARWRTIVALECMPGAILEHNVLYLANEEFFALIDPEPIITKNAMIEELRQQSEGEGTTSLEKSGIDYGVTLNEQKEEKCIFISGSIYDEFQVNDYEPECHRSTPFAKKFRNYCDLVKRLKVQEAMQQLRLSKQL